MFVQLDHARAFWTEVSSSWFPQSVTHHNALLVFFSIPYFTLKNKFILFSSSASSKQRIFCFAMNSVIPSGSTIVTKNDFSHRLNRKIYRLYSPDIYMPALKFTRFVFQAYQYRLSLHENNWKVLFKGSVQIQATMIRLNKKKVTTQ